MTRYDLAVVGGGTAGLTAAVGAAGVGAKVCLIERGRTGGDCLWTGCVPSKSLLASAHLAHRMRHADRLGLDPVEPPVDLGRVMARVREAQGWLAPHDSPERLAGLGVEVIRAEARFVGRGRLRAGDRLIRYRTALIATGSRPVLPPIPGLEEAGPLTTDTVWRLEDLPRRLVVLGGGAVGCELGQAFCRLGSRVTILEMEDTLLPRHEPEACSLVAGLLREEGIEVRTGSRAVRVEGASRLVVETDGRREVVEGDLILVAAGRRPDTEGLGLAAVGVETGDSGAVVVDARLRTTARGVYAAGDVTGAMPFTHVAAYHGRLVVQNALFLLRRRADYRAVPWVVFTDPEVAGVGMDERAARERWGTRVVVAIFDYAELDRAVCAGEPYGLAKLVAEPGGRLVGATVVAPAAGEAIAELAAWISSGGRIDRVSQTVHAYPTFAQGPARAADEYLREKWLGEGVRRFTRPVLRLLRLVGGRW